MLALAKIIASYVMFIFFMTTQYGAVASEAPKGIEILVPGIMSPKTVFVDQNGSPISLDHFKGKIVVLNLWATWCGPCVKEMPLLDRLAVTLSPYKAMVLIVSQDKGGVSIAKHFLDKLGIKNLPAYADPSGKLSRDMGIRGLPTSFIISPSGAIVGRVEGILEWDHPEIAAFILSLEHRERPTQ